MSKRSSYSSTTSSTALSSTASTTSTRSFTLQVFTETPKRSSASTLSDSVTATLRMLSPKRASLSDRAAAAPAAARAQEPTRACTRGSDTCPATVVRGWRSRVSTNAYSRSPWAAWLRFMKSMSIVAHGRAASARVCRCSSGLRSASIPAIHIFAGEKVCIQVITPRQSGSSLASPIARRIAAASVSTGFQTTRAGTSAASSSAAATRWDCSATCWRVSSPYSPWLPVRNQTSAAAKGSVRITRCSSLSVDVLIAGVEGVDVGRVDGQRLAELAGGVDGVGGALRPDRGLDRRLGRRPDGEDAVAAHEHRRRPGAGERLDDAAADRVVADQRERAHRDRPAELVGHRGEHAWDLLAARGPRRRVRAVRVHLAVDVRAVPVDVGVRVGVAGRFLHPVHDGAVEVADGDPLPGQLLVHDAAALDHEQVLAGHPLGDVAGGPGHQPVAGEVGVQRGDVLALLPVGAALGAGGRGRGRRGPRRNAERQRSGFVGKAHAGCSSVSAVTVVRVSAVCGSARRWPIPTWSTAARSTGSPATYRCMNASKPATSSGAGSAVCRLAPAKTVPSR